MRSQPGAGVEESGWKIEGVAGHCGTGRTGNVKYGLLLGLLIEFNQSFT